jgi:NAD(P)H-dependent flavin oxidoreductase YrpB (nitropropane dioxygenase family)
MLRTRFCELFGIDAPIMVAPMGPDLTGPELVAAVCNAGGFGILQAQLCSPPLLRQQIRYLRTLTDKPFGVNFVLHFPHRAGIEVCIAERVAALAHCCVTRRSQRRPALRLKFLCSRYSADTRFLAGISLPTSSTLARAGDRGRRFEVRSVLALG